MSKGKPGTVEWTIDSYQRPDEAVKIAQFQNVGITVMLSDIMSEFYKVYPVPAATATPDEKYEHALDAYLTVFTAGMLHGMRSERARRRREPPPVTKRITGLY